MDAVTFADVWSVLRWVVVVLAAGFVGQFGRYAAQRLLERRHARQASTREPPPDPVQAKAEKKRLKAQAKLEKKRAKAEAKRAGERD
ncbi:MAG: hypothetical protein ACP5G2_06750 [Candidatus Bipolaricaulaceae bacterium]